MKKSLLRKIKTQLISDSQISQNIISMSKLKLKKQISNSINQSTEKNAIEINSPTRRPNQSYIKSSQKISNKFFIGGRKSNSMYKLPSQKYDSPERRITILKQQKNKDDKSHIIYQQERSSNKLSVNKLSTTDEQSQLMKKPLFRAILKQYIDKLEQQTNIKKQLLEKIKKYDTYFHRIRLKNTEVSDDDRHLHNLKLKNLLQQQKINSLLYMIRNLRNKNKQETDRFQKSLLQYQPTIEKQLTEKLGEANQKIEVINNQLNDIKMLFVDYKLTDSQFGYDWEGLVIQLKNTKKKNIQSQQTIFNLNKRIESLLHHQKIKTQLQQQIELLKAKVSQQNYKILVLQNNIKKYQQQQNQLNDITQQLNHKLEQAHFEISQKQMQINNLNEKNKLLTEATSNLYKLQKDLIQYKTKLDFMNQQFYKNIFEEKSTIDKVNNCVANILQLSQSFKLFIKEMQKNHSQPISTDRIEFLKHIFQKNTNLYNCIIHQYKLELKVYYNQSITSNKLFNQLNDKINSYQTKRSANIYECTTLQERFNKYLRQIEKLSKKSPCSNCQQFIGYVKQIENLYLKLTQILKS